MRLQLDYNRNRYISIIAISLKRFLRRTNTRKSQFNLSAISKKVWKHNNKILFDTRPSGEMENEGRREKSWANASAKRDPGTGHLASHSQQASSIAAKQRSSLIVEASVVVANIMAGSCFHLNLLRSKLCLPLFLCYALISHGQRVHSEEIETFDLLMPNVLPKKVSSKEASNCSQIFDSTGKGSDQYFWNGNFLQYIEILFKKYMGL